MAWSYWFLGLITTMSLIWLLAYLCSRQRLLFVVWFGWLVRIPSTCKASILLLSHAPHFLSLSSYCGAQTEEGFLSPSQEELGHDVYTSIHLTVSNGSTAEDLFTRHMQSLKGETNKAQMRRKQEDKSLESKWDPGIGKLLEFKMQLGRQGKAALQIIVI